MMMTSEDRILFLLTCRHRSREAALVVRKYYDLSDLPYLERADERRRQREGR